MSKMVFGTLRNTENTTHSTNQHHSHLISEKAEQAPQNRDVEMTSAEQDDPLLKDTQTQYVIFPIEYEDIWKMYKSFVENIWTVQEHLSPLTFNDKETHFFKIFAAFFATSNSFGLVNENFVEEFAKTVQIAEAKFFYGHQLFIQNIHFEMYNKLFEILAKTEDERNELMTLIESAEASKAKRDLIKACGTYDFSQKLVACACLHGILFSSVNIIKDWIDRCVRNTMNNHEIHEIFAKMCTDLDLERDFTCLIVSHIKRKPSKDFIINLVDKFASVEYNFLVDTLKMPYFLGVKDFELKQVIDKRAAILKVKLIKASETKMEVMLDKENEKNMVSEEKNAIVFDHDF